MHVRQEMKISQNRHLFLLFCSVFNKTILLTKTKTINGVEAFNIWSVLASGMIGRSTTSVQNQIFHQLFTNFPKKLHSRCQRIHPSMIPRGLLTLPHFYLKSRQLLDRKSRWHSARRHSYSPQDEPEWLWSTFLSMGQHFMCFITLVDDNRQKLMTFPSASTRLCVEC